MKWFQGDIASAVEKSKSSKAVFVVFVEGKDEVSQGLAQTLNSTEVALQLETEKFVAIKIQSDSNTYVLFTEIYKVVPIPSIFFIGENGKPLEIISNNLSPSEMVSKIDTILVKINPQAKHSSADLLEAEKKAHSSNSDKISTNPVTSDFNQTSANLNVNIAKNSSEAITEEPSVSGIVQEGSDDKNKDVARAKLLIELQNKKKLEEEERKERDREIERRKMGKDAQKWRKQQHERQFLEAHEERMKEKAADAAAREKILRQIAEDKLERKRKYEMSIQEKNVKKQNKAQEENASRARAAVTIDMTKARIQFKSPTGNIITGTFEATSTLADLKTYVIQNANLPFQQFSMSSFFPRRDFTSADDNKTLSELELVPSSVILILPIKFNNQGTVKKSDDGGNIFSFFFWTLLAPVIRVYNYVMGYFRGRPGGGGNDNNNENRNPGSTRLGNINIDFGQFTNLRARRLGSQRTAKIKSRGNIHTLHSDDNDNDENNTWNGNSTQQM